MLQPVSSNSDFNKKQIKFIGLTSNLFLLLHCPLMGAFFAKGLLIFTRHRLLNCHGGLMTGEADSSVSERVSDNNGAIDNGVVAS